MSEPALYIGLMSGTSVDSIDAALVDLATGTPTLLGHRTHPIDAGLKSQILALCQPGDNELDRAGELDRKLGRHFADATVELLQAMDVSPQAVTAIGSHGQTIRHRPPGSNNTPFSLQIGDPNTIAELTGITTVADFRRRDMAAGGHGAPLAPAFHRAVFQSRESERLIVNIGGMANVTHLPADDRVTGFDTGPGNVLMDGWVQQQMGHSFDQDGHWAAQGEVQPALLSQLLDHPFFSLPPPKSTGREDFHLAWANQVIEQQGRQLAGCDVQATLLELTSQSIADAIKGIKRDPAAEIYLCGGGAHNRQLLSRLQLLLAPSPVNTTEALGLSPDWVEAVAFAWLAHQTLTRKPGNLPDVTGAEREVPLGGIYHP